MSDEAIVDGGRSFPAGAALTLSGVITTENGLIIEAAGPRPRAVRAVGMIDTTGAAAR